MTKENRIKLGKEWKRRILENKKLRKDKQLRVPKGITLKHPYILEAEGRAPAQKDAKQDSKKLPGKTDAEVVEERTTSSDDEGSKLADEIMKGGK